MRSGGCYAHLMEAIGDAQLSLISYVLLLVATYSEWSEGAGWVTSNTCSGKHILGKQIRVQGSKATGKV